MKTAFSAYNIPLIDVESEHCALIVDKGLSKLKNLHAHHVDLNNQVAVVETRNDGAEAVQEAVQSIRDLGYNVVTVRKQFPVLDMTCAACAVNVESVLSQQPGVVSAAVNFAAQTVVVEYVPGIVAPADMKQALQSIGYDLVVEETAEAREEVEQIHLRRYDALRRRTILAIALAIPLGILGMFFMDLPYVEYLLWAMATPLVLWLGRSFFINAWKQARTARPTWIRWWR